IDQPRFVVGTGNAVGPGLGNLCQGEDVNPVLHTLTGVASQDTILMGGRMQVDNAKIGGQYVTTVGGSKPIGFRIRRTAKISKKFDIDIDWYAAFTSAVSLTAIADMDYDTIDIAAAVGSGDLADLGTDGTISYAGNFSGPGTGSAGGVSAGNVEDGVTLEVYCDMTATLTNGGSASIQVTNIETAAEGNLGAFGTRSACTGSGAGSPSMTFVYDAATRSSVYFGGRLNGGTAVSFPAGGGTGFSTANTGGASVQLVLVSQ
ncbi:MAG: hypothetical protein OXT65_02960, partial [Alphaproteobacteria bacterium]|nr:hypothetical protein [Alphaproteobacteria bacterium]